VRANRKSKKAAAIANTRRLLKWNQSSPGFIPSRRLRSCIPELIRIVGSMDQNRQDCRAGVAGTSRNAVTTAKQATARRRPEDGWTNEWMANGIGQWRFAGLGYNGRRGRCIGAMKEEKKIGYQNQKRVFHTDDHTLT